ncbi:protein VAPYRIN-LIKE-like [Tasmannia lanceolata]|uniref:protein VAPYRIN-LIKE-like n=1 Tax=Tasmannia lanceolata TaxID=3420 RepID=UPI0040641C63
MDRLVSVDVKEITLTFKKTQRCSSTFRVTNLMHTMSVAISLSTKSSFFSFKPSNFSILSPLSSSTFSLLLDPISQTPPLSSPPETLIVRSSMLPTGKADPDELRRLFANSGRHVFNDAAIPISFLGPEVVEFLLFSSNSSSLSSPQTLKTLKTLETNSSSPPTLKTLETNSSPSQTLKTLKTLETNSSSPQTLKTLETNSSSPRTLKTLKTVETNSSSPQTLKTLKGLETLETTFLLAKAISGCSDAHISAFLHTSCRDGNPRFVSALIDAGGDTNSRDSEGNSLLSVAVSSGNLDVVRVLLAAGAEFDSDYRLFHNAASENRVDLLEELGNSLGGARRSTCLNCVDSIGRTPVHVAAASGHMEALKFCVLSGGDPNCVDFNGWSPLHCAAAEGHLEVVEFLLDCSFYTKYAVTKDGKTPFLLAFEKGHFHLFDALRLGDVLHRAATIDDVHGLKSCLSQGAKVNGRDQNGWTPLHRAAFKGRIESVKLLLSNGAQVDLVDDAGYTPLHCAVEAGQMEVALHLISQGACANSKSFNGLCPLNLDCVMSYPAVIVPLCGEGG